MGSNVIQLYSGFYASCPSCKNTDWLIRIDGLGDQWENILGTECNSCGFMIDWVKAENTCEVKS